ncbi:MAG: hypothetical protein F4Y27_01115 [Acidimicrobiaceae bacterium]|nr:hypothetical protein [Acidimicrobiaceae bacterium]MYG56850.1 hypothetical protein [Acidimicrobiaceae bacterium]MYJ97438.1 hypothetical protein [Acidimicrobiaceae bacterium]
MGLQPRRLDPVPRQPAARYGQRRDAGTGPARLRGAICGPADHISATEGPEGARSSGVGRVRTPNRPETRRFRRSLSSRVVSRRLGLNNCSDQIPDSGTVGSYSVGTTVSRSPVLVVSIDGLAPRHISRATMPTLTTLAREGASCFSARTLTPPETLPVHTSIFRGVDPTTHGLCDNTPAPLRIDAPSFLGAARAAGCSTAMFVSWLPFDSVIEPDAASQRFVIDSGYDLDDDRRIVEAVVATSADCDHDLLFVYLSQPDLSGHLHAWDSAEYVAAATRSDAALARLLGVVGREASVLVTTDHGGVGSDHDSTVREVMETFMVVRAPGRIQPGSGWSTASPLDVAPTVASMR